MKKLYSLRTIILASSLLLQLNTLCFHSRGAAGTVDLSFNPGFGTDGRVNTVAVQPNGQVMIGGTFLTVEGLARRAIARLNGDGSGDATIASDPNGGFNDVSTIVLQSDGKPPLGGYSNSVKSQ